MGDPFTVGCAILSRTAGPSTNLALKMVGTGPFAVVSYAPTREIQLKRFERYWGTKAKLSKLRVAYTPEASAQLVALLSGKADLIFPDPSLIRPLQSADKIVKIGSVIAATTLRVEMSAAKVPMSDVKVRRAIELAIDKPAAVRGAYLGYGAPSSHIPRGYAWAPPSARTPTPGRRRDRGEEAADPGRLSGGFSTSYLYIAGFSPASDRFAQVLKSQLGAVGIDLTLQPVDTPTYLDRLGKADYGLAFNQYPYFSDPLLYVCTSAGPEWSCTGWGSAAGRHSARCDIAARGICRAFATSRWRRTTSAFPISWLPHRRSLSRTAEMYAMSRSISVSAGCS